jgi:hypothetical protein
MKFLNNFFLLLVIAFAFACKSNNEVPPAPQCQPIQAQIDDDAFTFFYNADKSIQKIVLGSGSTEMRYSYDDQKRVSKVEEYYKNTLSSYFVEVYNNANQVIERRFYNAAGTESKAPVKLQYDAQGRIVRVGWSYTISGTENEYFAYEYDNKNNIIKFKRYNGVVGNMKLISDYTFEYDDKPNFMRGWYGSRLIGSKESLSVNNITKIKSTHYNQDGSIAKQSDIVNSWNYDTQNNVTSGTYFGDAVIASHNCQ